MNSNVFYFRDYIKGDFDAVQKIWRETGLARPERSDDENTIDRTLAFEGKLILMFEKESNELVGTSWITNDGRRLYLHHFGIKPSWQRKGLGKLLTIESLKFAKEKNLQIKLEVHKNNLTAIELYKTSGFNYLGDYLVYIIRDFTKIIF
jgi:ribosomal protein S18 acetylase RimI-like enzyme